MTLVRTFPVASVPVPIAARGGFARVEKISLSNKLDGERDSNAAPQSFADAKLARTPAYRNETAQGVSDEDALRLVPGFVAQVLSQVTALSRPDANSALLAYRRSHPQVPLACDRAV